MNILVTGGNGQLGNEMQIVSRDSNDKYFFTDVCDGYDKLDITDLDAIRSFVKDHSIDAIVNCAAWTNVDGAEDPKKYELVEKLNATAPENLAKAMKEVGGLLIHISTDYVFGKEPYNTPCRETQTGTPTGVYGATKKLGEEKIQRVFNSLPFREGVGVGSYIIIRTAWLYSEFGKNFCKTMLSLTATKPELKVVFDQVGTPTYALDLAKAIDVILKDYMSTVNGQRSTDSKPKKYSKSGIYHFSNEGVCSWYDFAKMIAEYSGHLECKILPCHSDEFPSLVTRPAYSVLDKSKIKSAFGVEVPYWTDSLKKCLTSIGI